MAFGVAPGIVTHFTDVPISPRLPTGPEPGSGWRIGRLGGQLAGRGAIARQRSRLALRRGRRGRALRPRARLLRGRRRGRAGRAGGDFLTSPEVGPLFGAVLARALDGWWEELGRPRPFVVAEAGAGPGTLARAVLAARAPLRAGAATTWRSSAPRRPAAPPPAPRVAQRAGAAGARSHVVVANELLDNLPSAGRAARRPPGLAGGAGRRPRARRCGPRRGRRPAAGWAGAGRAPGIPLVDAARGRGWPRPAGSGASRVLVVRLRLDHRRPRRAARGGPGCAPTVPTAPAATPSTTPAVRTSPARCPSTSSRRPVVAGPPGRCAAPLRDRRPGRGGPTPLGRGRGHAATSPPSPARIPHPGGRGPPRPRRPRRLPVPPLALRLGHRRARRPFGRPSPASAHPAGGAWPPGVTAGLGRRPRRCAARSEHAPPEPSWLATRRRLGRRRRRPAVAHSPRPSCADGVDGRIVRPASAAARRSAARRALTQLGDGTGRRHRRARSRAVGRCGHRPRRPAVRAATRAAASTSSSPGRGAEGHLVPGPCQPDHRDTGPPRRGRDRSAATAPGQRGQPVPPARRPARPGARHHPVVGEQAQLVVRYQPGEEGRIAGAQRWPPPGGGRRRCRPSSPTRRRRPAGRSAGREPPTRGARRRRR